MRRGEPKAAGVKCYTKLINIRRIAAQTSYTLRHISIQRKRAGVNSLGHCPRHIAVSRNQWILRASSMRGPHGLFQTHDAQGFRLTRPAPAATPRLSAGSSKEVALKWRSLAICSTT
jgi:hypothetical protein